MWRVAVRALNDRAQCGQAVYLTPSLRRDLALTWRRVQRQGGWADGNQDRRTAIHVSNNSKTGAFPAVPVGSKQPKRKKYLELAVLLAKIAVSDALAPKELDLRGADVNGWW